mgnify:CR=1 FL=1
MTISGTQIINHVAEAIKVNQLDLVRESLTLFLEKELKFSDKALENNYEQTIAQANFFEKYNGKKDQLSLLMKKWEVVAEELMEFES